MKWQNGFSEIAVVVACCIVSLALGYTWGSGLILAGGIALMFALLASVVNYKVLSQKSRVSALDCLTTPFSTLRTIIPLAMMRPGIEMIERLNEAQEKTPR